MADQPVRAADIPGVEPLTQRMLRRVQDDAWAAGHARVPLAALLKSRRTRGADLFVDRLDEDVACEGLSFSGVHVSALDAAALRVPGGALLQDSPGMARSSARWRRYDPHRIGTHVQKLVRTRDWSGMLAIARVAEEWESIVGADVAAHARVEQIEAGCLKVRTTSTAWAVHLRTLLPQLMRNIDAAAGPGVVDTVIVKGPDQPSWSHGPRTVRGRGVRDTYA